MSEEKQIPEVLPSAPAPALRDKRVLPEGVVPKQAQGYVIAGLAVLILMAVMFSKNHTKPAVKDTTTSPLAVSNDMNQRKIKELEQDLSADQLQTQQAQKSGANAPENTTAPASSVPAPAMQLPPSTDPPRDPVKDAEQELAFKSRFVSNLVTEQPHLAMPSNETVSSGDLGNAVARPASALQTAPAPQATDAAKKWSARSFVPLEDLV